MSNLEPMIASDIGAPAEIIDDKINGYIVSPTMPTKLANTIKILLLNNEIREDVGRTGRVHVLKNLLYLLPYVLGHVVLKGEVFASIDMLICVKNSVFNANELEEHIGQTLLAWVGQHKARCWQA